MRSSAPHHICAKDVNTKHIDLSDEDMVPAERVAEAVCAYGVKAEAGIALVPSLRVARSEATSDPDVALTAPSQLVASPAGVAKS